jgi:long-chain acyl-CoA synthetase
MYPTVEISVRDEAGNEKPTGEAGDLWLKTPTLVKEYWNRPDANAKDFVAGWFNSGDIGYFDEDGYLFLSDRAKDMVIRGGENIYPAEIEGVLHDHPDVEEVAAFGVPDEALGEQLAVAVIAKPGGELSTHGIQDFAARHLARFKIPHYVWIRTEALPRNASGKVLKKDLKASFQP